MATGAVPSTPKVVADDTRDSDAPKGDAGKLDTKPERVGLSAVHGDIYHPFTHTKFTTDAYKSHDLDNWVQVQLDAGKLKKED